MMRRWACATPILAILVLSSASSDSQASRLPEWARPIVENAPPLDDADSRHSTRVLFDETHLTVNEDGTVTRRWRFARQILTSQLSKISVRGFNYVEGSKVKRSKAWNVPLGEKAKKSSLPLLDLTLSDSFLTDSRTRFVAVDGVAVGSIVLFECEVEESPVALSFTQLFLDNAPVSIERLEVEIPSPAWSVRGAWLRHPGPQPIVEGNIWRWELDNLPGPEDEPLAEPPEEHAPLLVVGLLPPPGARVRPAVMKDWPALAAWFDGIAAGRDAVTPEISAAAAKSASAAGFLDSARAAALLVRDTVRYLANDVGVGGYQPRPASMVLSQLVGDCKDKGTLFRAILAADGITSYPLLVNLSSPGTVSDEIPSPAAFDHFVVAVALPSDPPTQAPGESAILDGGELGRLLLVDTTNRYASFGTLSASLAGKRGLLVAGGKSRLVTLPVAQPGFHVIERRSRVRILPDGTLAIASEARFLGEPAAEGRAAYRSSPTERRKQVDRQLMQTFVRAEPESYAAGVETAEGAFTETLAWKVAPPSSGGLKEIPLFAGAADSLPRAPLSKRKSAVHYTYPITLRYESTIEGAPDQVALPKAESLRSAGWSITSTYEREAGIVKGRWELILSQTHFEPRDFEDLKRLWLSIGATGKAAVRLKSESASHVEPFTPRGRAGFAPGAGTSGRTTSRHRTAPGSSSHFMGRKSCSHGATPK